VTDTKTEDRRTAFAGAHRAAGYREDTAPPAPPTDLEPATGPQTPVEPDSAPVVDELSIDTGSLELEFATLTDDTPPVAETGWRGLVAKTGVKIAPSAKETATRAAAEQLRQDEETIRQATWTRAVSILVANPKGGTGKTPISLLLGGTLAAVRGGSVAIMEVSDDPGALTFRAEGRPALGLGELVRDAGEITSAGQLAGYTAPQTSFASVIGTVGRRAQLTGDDVTNVAAVLDSYYAIRVMDSGNQPSSSAFTGALGVADALVVPVLNAGDAVLEAISMLDGLRAAGHERLADTATILRLVDGRPEHRQITERIDRIIVGAHVGAVLEIPYDPHIAERNQLTLGSLAPATYRAFAAAAATVIRTLQNTEN
jgi:MinD-like ATPase involved in chromosome partitioning or flagellar assembly